MSYELKARKNVPVKMWVPPHEVESSALDQLKNVADLPQTFMHVAAMPDVHTGKGATVGSVIAMKDAVCPAAVGVDIGCGMEAIATNFEDNFRIKDLENIRDGILERVPVGFNAHSSVHKDVKNNSLWEEFDNLNSGVHQYKNLAMQQLGTLGGGNHFIEVSTDKDNRVWIVLHSGSRRIGKEIADVYIREAMNQPHNKEGLPDKALSTLLAGTEVYDRYMNDLIWAQRYAAENRKRMLQLITRYLESLYPSLELDMHVSCHHNFAQIEQHFGEEVVVTRKGAIRAREGEWGIIPGAMGATSHIVKGKGCKEAFESAPHGAGRRMSRSKAKKKYNLADLNETMSGIVCNASKNTVDEIMFSYKNIYTVMSNAEPLVESVYQLDQILNIKG
jgi:tRNA-splicing ligase RtcB